VARTKLYTGGTGCGKTYRAITEATSFVIVVPCRQLAYEIYWDYPKEISRIDTGEVHMGDSTGNQVCVYENLPEGVIEQATLIVDEAHYLNDADRGGALFEKILVNMQAGKEIILLTATDTLSDEVKELLGVVETELQPFCEAPAKVEVNFSDFCAKVRAGMTTIVFTKFMPDYREIEYYASSFGLSADSIGVLSANTPSYERVKTQLDFKRGNLQLVIATNVLAQGLNFPAQGVLIEYNEWDNWEIVTQKLGRVARPLFGHREGYFCLNEMPNKSKHCGVPQKTEREAVTYWSSSETPVDISGWGFLEHEVPKNLGYYKDFKYSYRFLREMKARLGSLEPSEQRALDFLENQSRLVGELLRERPQIRVAA
jgi:superfamily II DNA or RNA helicase